VVQQNYGSIGMSRVETNIEGIMRVAEPHPFDAAQAPGINFDGTAADPVAPTPAPILLKRKQHFKTNRS
jgi:hypothetical protein